MNKQPELKFGFINNNQKTREKNKETKGKTNKSIQNNKIINTNLF